MDTHPAATALRVFHDSLVALDAVSSAHHSEPSFDFAVQFRSPAAQSDPVPAEWSRLLRLQC